MQIVKLGGSLITAKRAGKAAGQSRQKVFLEQHVERISRELKHARTPLVLVHGAGSFGHVGAHRYGLHKGVYSSKRQAKGAAAVSHDVRELNLKVMKVLAGKGLNCISIPPNVTVTNRNGKINSFDTTYYKKYLALGLIPISFGDLVHDTKTGISICSGDDIMYELARAFKPSRAIFVTDEDGVYSRNPRDFKNAELITDMTRKHFAELTDEQVNVSGPTDVTGGMYRKAEVCMEISREGVECIILNGLKRGRLTRALRGENVIGTYF